MDLRAMDPASEKELDAVLELFRLVFPRDMSREFYRWRFLANPFGPPFVTLLWDGDTLAGHYAASAMRASIDGVATPAAQSMTTMTHPNYRNRDVFTTLASHLYEQMTVAGRRMIWGFPNTKSHFGLVQRLGWHDVAVAPTMTLELDSPSAGEAVGATDEPGGDVDALFRRAGSSRHFLSARDATYLRWRYVDNPENRYQFLQLESDPGSALFVGKTYDVAGRKSLELVDYLYGDRPEAGAALLRAMMPWAAERGFAMVRTWMPLSDPLFPFLEKLRFAPKEPLTYFCTRPLAGPAVPGFDDPKRWALTMGDSDNY